MNIFIEHDKEKQLFFSTVEGKHASLQYKVLPNEKVLDLVYTYVPPELRGQHIAQHLVEFALNYARSNHYKIIPRCPYVYAYFQRHPKENDLIYDS